MMKKQQSPWWRMMWIAVTVPLVGIALTAFSKPKEALKEVVNSSVEIIEQPIVEALTSDVEEAEVVDAPAPMKEVKEMKAVEAVKAGDKVTGTVKSAQGAVVGANIVELDENGRIVANTITDDNGNFALKVKDPKNKIRISYVGMKTQTLELNNKLDVTMEEAMKFHQIQVVGSHDSIETNGARYIDININEGDDKTFNVIESTPNFPGGFSELMKYMNTHLKYPEVAREIKVEAEVTVKFIIDKTGFVRSPKVINVSSQSPIIKRKMISTDGTLVDENETEATRNYNDAIEALKEEAIHMVRSMPRWNPGRQNGKRVETSYTLPVKFKLL